MRNDTQYGTAVTAGNGQYHDSSNNGRYRESEHTSNEERTR